ncbi:MAG TPA: hypothetical protein VFW00_11930 [Rhodocyclaceae bacterium]|nr:hypothetical protein [Rhodocyclaceae bacterium]
MKKFQFLSAIFLFLMASVASAANAPVNIVYPINGNAYNNYFTSSFGATCPGGPWTAVWGFDSTTIGSGTYYDQISVQFSHKLPSGGHSFWVKTSCGSDVVKFNVL